MGTREQATAALDAMLGMGLVVALPDAEPEYPDLPDPGEPADYCCYPGLAAAGGEPAA